MKNDQRMLSAVDGRTPLRFELSEANRCLDFTGNRYFSLKPTDGADAQAGSLLAAVAAFPQHYKREVEKRFLDLKGQNKIVDKVEGMGPFWVITLVKRNEFKDSAPAEPACEEAAKLHVIMKRQGLLTLVFANTVGFFVPLDITPVDLQGALWTIQTAVNYINKEMTWKNLREWEKERGVKT